MCMCVACCWWVAWRPVRGAGEAFGADLAGAQKVTARPGQGDEEQGQPMPAPEAVSLPVEGATRRPQAVLAERGCNTEKRWRLDRWAPPAHRGREMA